MNKKGGKEQVLVSSPNIEQIETFVKPSKDIEQPIKSTYIPKYKSFLDTQEIQIGKQLYNRINAIGEQVILNKYLHNEVYIDFNKKRIVSSNDTLQNVITFILSNENLFIEKNNRYIVKTEVLNDVFNKDKYETYTIWDTYKNSSCITYDSSFVKEDNDRLKLINAYALVLSIINKYRKIVYKY